MRVFNISSLKLITILDVNYLLGRAASRAGAGVCEKKLSKGGRKVVSYEDDI